MNKLDKFFVKCKANKLLYFDTTNTDFVYKGKKRKVLHIIANGPSTQKSIYKVDEIGGDVMMVNYASESPFFEKYKPKYLCLADPNFFTKKVSVYNREYKKRLWNVLNEVNWKMNIIIPNYAEKIQKINNRNIGILVCNVNNIEMEYCELKYKLYLKNKISPIFQNVAIEALYSALQLGYKEIYIHGLDFDMVRTIRVDENNVYTTATNHYYEKKETIVNEKNKVYLEFENILISLKQFYDLRKYADRLNCNIVNMSQYSLIDAFDKYKYKK